jgi:hypothetical protein
MNGRRCAAALMMIGASFNPSAEALKVKSPAVRGACTIT